MNQTVWLSSKPGTGHTFSMPHPSLRPPRVAALVLMFAALFSGGCQLWSEPVRGPRPPAATFGEHRHIERDLEIRVGEHIHIARAVLALTPDATRITITDQRDRLMVEMRYGQGRLNVKRTPYLPAEVSADDLIADLQLALWPLERLRAGLTPGWTLAADDEGRILRFNGTTEAQVDYQSDEPSSRPLPVYNARHDYLLILSPADPGA